MHDLRILTAVPGEVSKRWATVAALTFSLLASGCGGSGDSGYPSFDEAVKGDQVDRDSFLTALRGSFRNGSTAVVSFDVRGGAGLRGAGSVRYTADGMESSLRIDDWQVEDATIEIRTVGGTTYMRVPESRGLWVNLSKAGPGMPGVDLAEDADPRRAIDDLRDTVEEIRFGGDETIGGVRARRFQVVTRAKGADHPTVTQYWFDGRSRVVRRHSELQQASSATFTWTRWGKPVEIVRPRPGSVITLERLEHLRRKKSEPR